MRPSRAALLRCALVCSVAAHLGHAGCASSTAPAPGAAEATNVPANASGWMPGRPGLAARRATGQAEVGEARRTLRTVGEACGDACPALDALRAGVKHLCELDDTRDDQKLCKEFRLELLAEEARLKPSCGVCAPPAPPPDASDF